MKAYEYQGEFERAFDTLIFTLYFYEILQNARVITVDNNAAYPKALHELKAEKALPAFHERRRSKYFNKLVEQDHRFLKRLVKPGIGFFSDPAAWRTLQGYETVHKKDKYKEWRKGDGLGQATFIIELFGVAI